MHIDGSNCFDPLITVGLTGTLTGGNISVTSRPVRGQVMTFSGAITNNTFTGTYSINGGCADGEQGNVAGIIVPSITYGGVSSQRHLHDFRGRDLRRGSRRDSEQQRQL